MRTSKVNIGSLDLVPRGRRDHTNHAYEKVAAMVAGLKPEKALTVRPDLKDGETLVKAHSRIRAGVRRALDRDPLTYGVKFKMRTMKDSRFAITRLS